MVLDSDQVKERMLAHLQEMMEDGEAYNWSMARSYHVAWLQHVEQGQATWDDQATKFKLRRALIWHCILPPTKASSAPSQPSRQQSAANKVHWKTGPHSEPAKPGDKACAAFKGQCVNNASHLSDLHICCCATTWNSIANARVFHKIEHGGGGGV